MKSTHNLLGRKSFAASVAIFALALSPILTGCRSRAGLAWFDEQEKWVVEDLTAREPVAGVLDRRFDTAGSLAAARELLLSGPPFLARYEALEFETNLMDEKALLTFAPSYARYNMEASLLESGLGLHLMHGPSIRDFYMRTAERWKSHPDALAARYEAIQRRVGLEKPPIENLIPVFLPYDSGDPFYTQAPELGNAEEGTRPDAATLRWNEARFAKTFTGRTLGHAMLAELTFADHYFRETRKQDDGAARPLLGATAEEGFLGALYLEMATSKLIALAASFAYDPTTGELGRMELDGYNPEERLLFVPSRVRPVFTEVTVLGETALPPKAEILLPAETPVKSRLVDQVCLLRALCAYVEASNPRGRLARQGVFGPADETGPLFPTTYHGLAQAVARVIYRNIVHMHFERKSGTLVSYALPEERGKIVHIGDAALAVLALDAYLDTLSEQDPIYPQVLTVLEAQAGFLLTSQRFDGAYPRTVGARTAFSTDPIVWPLEAQGLSIRANLVAYDRLKDPEFTLAAIRTYRYMMETLWAIDFQIFRSEEVNSSGLKFSVYSPSIYAAALGALRELAEATCDQQYADKNREFIEGLPFTGLLLSELAPTEEQLFAGKSDEPDPDGDGIPYAPRACPPFGAAPVFASKTIVKIP